VLPSPKCLRFNIFFPPSRLRNQHVRQALERACFDINHRSAFTSNAPLIRQVVNEELPERLHVSLAAVRQFLASKPVVQIFRRAKKRFARVPVYASRIDQCWQGDVAFVDSDEGRRAKTAVLVLVDVLSRKTRALRLPNLRAPAMVATFRSLYESEGHLCKLLATDLGSEFISTQLGEYLSSLGVKQAFLRDSRIKASLAERRIADIKRVVSRYQAATGTWTLDDGILHQLVEQMNDRPHPALPKGMTPNSVRGEDEREICDFRYGTRWRALSHTRFVFLLHDRVRLNMTAEQFQKANLPFAWSTVIYKIVDRHPSRPPTYTVTPDLENAEPILGKFYAEELLPVDEETPSQLLYPVRRIVRRRVERATGRQQTLVEYATPLRHIEWVYSELLDKGSIIGSGGGARTDD